MGLSNASEACSVSAGDGHIRPKGSGRVKGVVIVLLLFIAAVLLFLFSDFFSVRDVTLSGADGFGGNDIIEFVRESAAGNGFMLLLDNCSVDTLDKAAEFRLAELEQRVLFAFPYVKDVCIRFEPRGALKISISERNAVLFIKEHDDYVCIDASGYVLAIMDEHTYKEFIQNKSNGVSLVKGIEIGEYSVGRALTAGKDKRIDDIIKLCAAVNENKVLRGKIESIDVSVDGEIYMYAPPSLVIKFGGFDGMYERILKVSGAFEAGYDGNADGTIDFTTGGYDVFKPNSSKSDGES